MIMQTHEFKGDLAAMLQRHFYSKVSHKMVLFTAKEGDYATPPTDANGSPMQWIQPQPGVAMYEGNVLPSGLALSTSKVKKLWGSSVYYLDPQGESTRVSFLLEHEFLARWEAIHTTFPFED